MKLLDLAVQAVDGTKVSANASVYRTHNAEELRQLLNRVEAAIRDLEAQNEAGEDTTSAHLPRELANKETQREQVRQGTHSRPPPTWGAHMDPLIGYKCCTNFRTLV